MSDFQWASMIGWLIFRTNQVPAIPVTKVYIHKKLTNPVK